MRTLTLTSCVCLALPMMAQAQSCRGVQSLDLGSGTQACVVKIEEGAITTTTTRDDHASTQKRKRAQPMVGAIMTGSAPSKRATVKKQMLAMCKATQAKVSVQFANQKYNRVILIQDWTKAGGDVQAGFSSDTCKGFRFFDS